MALAQSTVVITGAARGIGRCIAETFARLDAHIALLDRLDAELADAARAITDAGGQALPLHADITDPTQVDHALTQIAERFSPPHVLINNAGTFSHIGPTWEADPDAWFGDTRVNLFGAFLCCRAALPSMVERGSGRIINMVAAGGVGDPHAHCTSYAVSKTALMRLTEGLAAECQPHHVQVFALAPPAITSAMTEFIARSEGGRRYRPTFAHAFDAGFEHTPQMVADWCVRLARGDADALTGRYIRVTDDPDALLAEADRIQADDLRTLRIREL